MLAQNRSILKGCLLLMNKQSHLGFVTSKVMRAASTYYNHKKGKTNQTKVRISPRSLWNKGLLKAWLSNGLKYSCIFMRRDLYKSHNPTSFWFLENLLRVIWLFKEGINYWCRVLCSKAIQVIQVGLYRDLVHSKWHVTMTPCRNQSSTLKL